MISWVKKIFSKGIWYSLAMLIVVLMAGPEVLISMELMALVEVLGASTFVLAYLAGLRLFFVDIMKKYCKFESHSNFFIPTLNTIRQMPALLIHALPERTITICFFGSIFLVMTSVYLKALGI